MTDAKLCLEKHKMEAAPERCSCKYVFLKLGNLKIPMKEFIL